MSRKKLGSAGFGVEAILLAISGLLMPHASTPTRDLQERLKPLGEHEFRTIVASLSMATGFWAVLIGVAGVNHSFTTYAVSGAAWLNGIDRRHSHDRLRCRPNL
jgi:hypothetical protein